MMTCMGDTGDPAYRTSMFPFGLEMKSRGSTVRMWPVTFRGAQIETLKMRSAFGPCPGLMYQLSGVRGPPRTLRMWVYAVSPPCWVASDSWFAWQCGSPSWSSQRENSPGERRQLAERCSWNGAWQAGKLVKLGAKVNIVPAPRPLMASHCG